MTARRPRPPRHDPDPVTAAKAVALAFRQAVAASDPVGVARVTAGMSWRHVVALAVVMAEGMPPGDFRLLHVTRTSDEKGASAA